MINNRFMLKVGQTHKGLQKITKNHINPKLDFEPNQFDI